MSGDGMDRIPAADTEEPGSGTEQAGQYTRETALAFRKNPSERNKQKAFLRYYGQDDTSGPDIPPLRR